MLSVKYAKDLSLDVCNTHNTSKWIIILLSRVLDLLTWILFVGMHYFPYSRVCCLPTLFFCNRRDTLIYSLTFLKQILKQHLWVLARFLFWWDFFYRQDHSGVCCLQRKPTKNFINENHFHTLSSLRKGQVKFYQILQSFHLWTKKEEKFFFSTKIIRT